MALVDLPFAEHDEFAAAQRRMDGEAADRKKRDVVVRAADARQAQVDLGAQPVPLHESLLLDVERYTVD